MIRSKLLSPLAALVAATLLTSCAGVGIPRTYLFEITNNLPDELLAPILVAPAVHDRKIFVDSYVTDEAETQILSGDPSELVAVIGDTAVVAHGNDGPPGVLLAPGKSLTFRVITPYQSIRVLAMVAPTKVPDNYVSTVVSVVDSTSVKLDRFDIGHDERTKSVSRVAFGVVSLTIRDMGT